MRCSGAVLRRNHQKDAKRDRLAFVARTTDWARGSECLANGAVDDKSRRSQFCVSQSDLRISHPRLCHTIFFVAFLAIGKTYGTSKNFPIGM